MKRRMKYQDKEDDVEIESMDEMEEKINNLNMEILNLQAYGEENKKLIASLTAKIEVLENKKEKEKEKENDSLFPLGGFGE